MNTTLVLPQIEIDPAMAVILEEMRAAPRPPLDDLPLQEARDLIETSNIPWNAVVPQMAGGTCDFHVASHGRSVPVRLYRPVQTEHLPLIIYAHGGGWTVGSLRTHDRFARLLASLSSLPVLSVEYALSPEHPFPAARDDIASVVNAVRRGLLGNNASREHHALVGDSAGAHVVLTAALADPQNSPDAIALVYGCFSRDFNTRSYELFGDGAFGLSERAMRYYWANLLDSAPSDVRRAADLRNWNLRGLPATYLIAAGLDPLRDDSIRFGRALVDAGVPFTFELVPGVIHGFMQMTLRLPAAERAMEKLAAFLRTELAKRREA